MASAKLTASDAGTGDAFGTSVALSGSTAVVGAPGKSAGTGAVYVFAYSGSTWSQQARLTAQDAATGDAFGSSVALSASTAVVGAPGKNSSTGAAYVFAHSGTAWSQQAKLTAHDAAAGDRFGTSVAISLRAVDVVVGAPGKGSSAGVAYVIVHKPAGWLWQAELLESNGAPGDQFGSSVSIFGPTAVVGAPGDNSGQGAAYVFVYTTTSSPAGWSQEAKLTTSDGAAGDGFGSSVALSGSTVTVGAPARNSSTGEAYAFAHTTAGWSEQAKLAASDGAAGDQFGRSVALSGSTAVVGVPAKNTNMGAAYVFVVPGQRAELTSSDLTRAGGFGGSVAVSGSTAVVGASTEAEQSYQGMAYVFTRSGTTWSLQAKLTTSDANVSNFGYALALSGSTLVIGAPGAGSGAVYVFTRSGTTWLEQAKLTASDAAAGDQFGGAAALSGSTAVVGAPGKASSTGVAYVFANSGTTWSQQAKLSAADAAPNDRFGNSVAISGSTAVIGAVDDFTGRAAAYVFAHTTGGWSQQAELTAPDTAVDNFGTSVAISGSTALVGAPFENSGTGAAYVFVHNTSGWAQQTALTAADAAAGDQFGSSVALAGSTAVVGAPPKTSSLGSTGAAYVFVHSTSGWSQDAKLSASDAAAGDDFGWSVALSGSTDVVGAPHKNSSTGAAYVFQTF